MTRAFFRAVTEDRKPLIQKKRSNYYETASKCKKIEKITVTGNDHYKEKEYVSKEVLAADFEQYIMMPIELETIIE